MRRSLLLLPGLLLLALSAPAQDQEFHERVNEAIDRGVAWLKERQGTDGSFGVIGGDVNYEGGSDIYRYPHGPTALALLTLLKCGVPPDDPVVARGFKCLERLGRIPESTYEIATLMLAVEARTNQVKRERKLEAIRRMQAKPGEKVDLDVKLPRRDLAWMKELADGLVQRWKDGAWRYGIGRSVPGGDRDMSNTQLAMLALYTASRCGVKVPTQIVQQTILWTLEQQEATGPEQPRYVPEGVDREYAPAVDHARGWAYIRGSTERTEGNVTGTMTTGGLIVLITGRTLLERESPRLAKAMSAQIDVGIHDGLAWLDKNYRVDTNPPSGGSYHLMYLYGLERVGDLLRVHLIGSHDWYDTGARWLLEHQIADGRWYKEDTHKPYNLLNTCFALLFLEKASLVVSTE
jgi:hypothetical protein